MPQSWWRLREMSQALLFGCIHTSSSDNTPTWYIVHALHGRQDCRWEPLQWDGEPPSTTTPLSSSSAWKHDKSLCSYSLNGCLTLPLSPYLKTSAKKSVWKFVKRIAFKRKLTTPIKWQIVWKIQDILWKGRIMRKCEYKPNHFKELNGILKTIWLRFSQIHTFCTYSINHKKEGLCARYE